MRTRLVRSLLVFIGLAGLACGSTPAGPLPTAAITVRVPASIAARVCTRCGNLVGELEVALDVVIEETAGVGGRLVSVTNFILAGSGGTIEGPGNYDAAGLALWGVTSLRINAGGTLTITQIGIHFAPSERARLPGTLSFTVNFVDDNGHTITRDVVIQVTT